MYFRQKLTPFSVHSHCLGQERNYAIEAFTRETFKSFYFLSENYIALFHPKRRIFKLSIHSHSSQNQKFYPLSSTGKYIMSSFSPLRSTISLTSKVLSLSLSTLSIAHSNTKHLNHHHQKYH